ncbi:ABC transporter ATP-binding protein [Streptomyces calidiresistens]|uniref:ATP-binding cassette domain-containing protein n=1 Tax=Streptomyces calidiresistens TaxID=1485586 RepID=A0A7W3T608_9ACTN|nr:ABC transporter ATP-binding protein [Streptomyces calidiresistens]MBB0231589.1 ATP-binding cassette domain-containing protein [Streptomyces calidiresistens]
MRLRDLPHPDPGEPDTRSGPRFLLWLFRRQLRGQTKALCWGTLHMGAVACLPVVVGAAVQAAVESSAAGLVRAGLLLACLGLVMAVADTMLHRSAVTNWITAAARVQQLLARHTARLGAVLTRRVAAGEVVKVSTGDVEKIGWLVESASRFSAAVVVTGAVCAGLVLHEPRLGLIVVLGIVAVMLTVFPLVPAATRRADRERARSGRAAELASDTVAGLRVLRGIGGEELFLGRYRRASDELRVASVHTARMWSLIDALQVAVPGTLLLVVVWQGHRLAADGAITPGGLVTVYGAVLFLLFPLRLFQEGAMAWAFSRPAARRAVRVLSMRRGDTTGGDGVPEPSGPPALHDPLTGLTAPAGRLTAVVHGDADGAEGPAARLGGRPPDEDEGSASPSVEIDGHPASELPRAVVRATVLVQDKDPVLLSGTLAELLDVPASGRVDAATALAAASCSDVLDSLAHTSPEAARDPLLGRITERGRSLSGGQRQRLALARSLLADPPVLVLDEPTSAVDAHTEARIGAALRELRAGRTTVVLTSSPLLLEHADRVVLLLDGRVAAEGTHHDLWRDVPGYRAVVGRDTGADPSDPAADRTAVRSESLHVEENA